MNNTFFANHGFCPLKLLKSFYFVSVRHRVRLTLVNLVTLLNFSSQNLLNYWIPGMVAHAIVVLACKQFVLLCVMYLVLYSFNITLSWSAIMLLDSVLINFYMKLYICMNEFAFMYVYAYMSLCFMLLDSVLINFICNCIYVCMSLFLCMTMYMYTWAYVLY
jgi:hypothetical protein